MRARVIRFSYMFFFLISICGVELSEAAEKLTLNQAIETALEKNLDIQIAKGNEEIQKNNAHIGNAGLLPSVDIVSGINYQERNQTGAIAAPNASSSSSTTTNAEIQASLTIFDGLSNINRFYKLKQQSKGGSLEARQNIENVVLAVSQSYFEVANGAEQLQIKKDALVISKERLDRAQKRAQYGQVSRLDVLSATVDMNTDSVAYLNAKLSLNQAKRTLNVLLNRKESTLFEVVTDVRFDTQFSLEALVANAKERNASYLIQLNRIEQAETDVSINTSKFLPKLAASVGYGFSQYEEGFSPDLSDPSEGLSANLNLSFNLFNGFQDKISRENAAITLKNQERLKEKVWLELEQEIANTYETYRNSLRIMTFEAKNLESAELNFKRTNEQFNIGQVNITTFREAQLNLIQAKSTLSKARYDAKTNEIKLLKLAGELVEGK